MNTDALLNSVHSNANESEERKSVNRIIVQNHFLEVLLKLTDNHTLHSNKTSYSREPGTSTTLFKIHCDNTKAFCKKKSEKLVIIFSSKKH